MLGLLIICTTVMQRFDDLFVSFFSKRALLYVFNLSAESSTVSNIFLLIRYLFNVSSCIFKNSCHSASLTHVFRFSQASHNIVFFIACRLTDEREPYIQNRINKKSRCTDTKILVANMYLKKLAAKMNVARRNRFAIEATAPF